MAIDPILKHDLYIYSAPVKLRHSPYIFPDSIDYNYTTVVVFVKIPPKRIPGYAKISMHSKTAGVIFRGIKI
jgi:hypothetical protein